jgi:hypothetical protein
MGEKVNLPADAATAKAIWQTYGLASAFEALGGPKPKSQLPGFALALALVEKELADHRANMSGAVYRCAAKAGFDVSNVVAIYSNIKDGKPHIEVELGDLVDAAEHEEEA